MSQSNSLSPELPKRIDPVPPLANNGHAPKTKQPGALAKFGQLRAASNRPLPTQTGNGTYLVQKTQTGLVEDLKYLRWQVLWHKITGQYYVDDKTMLMERIIQVVAGLPDKSRNRQLLTNDFISELWNSLEHPPTLFIGDEFRYRKADGSFNNIHMPLLGAAGSVYAKSVQTTIAAPTALPDPGLIFDAVMGRSEYKEHPNRVSSILWYWATIIIHDLFWTDQRNTDISKTSSYLDLSPLYGSNQAMQDTVRTFRDGLLKPDTYADKRLLGMPPCVSVILIMFNRFHNYVAGNLAAINEGGRFTRPAGKYPDNWDEADETIKAAWRKYDNDLFQTARLVTSGLYINITLVDYVRNIVNLNRCDTTFTLDPRANAGIDVGTPQGADRGTGNVVSAEFNLCYRWHSCISARDEKWVEEFYEEVLGKPAKDASMADLLKGFVQFERSIPEEPEKRTFGGFERGSDGKFSDDDLIGCLTAGVEDVAGAFGARNVPQAMRPVEILGILQGRRWELAGLNEFRKHFGLQPYETFEDINSDPAVSNSLRNLYEHPDFVELYPGIVAEEAKNPMVPGVGIAPTYTVSRVVLSDAVVLVRGDRHYTTDYGPKQLTNWGYREVDYDMGINHGCVFYKLFIRAFPNHFRHNSVYAHYPMVVPDENLRILKSLGRDHLFDFSRPSVIPQRINITSFGAVRRVLEDADLFRVTWHEGLSFLMGEGGRRFMLAGDSALHSRQRECMRRLLYGQDPDDTAWTAHIKAFYADTAAALLKEKSFQLRPGSHQIDVVHDFGNLVHTHFAARVFNLPLKSTANPRGVFSEQELYGILALIFVVIFFDIDPVKSFPLRQKTKPLCAQLGAVIDTNVKLALRIGMRGLFSGPPIPKDPLAMYGIHMAKGLYKAGLSPYDIAWSQILPTAGAMVPNQAQVFAQAVDFYLAPGPGARHVPDIYELAVQPSSAATDALLLGYAMEGIRLAGTFGSYREAASDTVIVEDNSSEEIPVRAGDRVFVSFVSAARDPVQFPDPENVNPKRPIDSYIHYGVGPHVCLGREISQVALVELFRVLFSRKNLRRVAGLQGELKKIPRPGGFLRVHDRGLGLLFSVPGDNEGGMDE